MKLNKATLELYAAILNSPDRVKRRQLYADMFVMYEGGGRELIKRKIRQEFKKQDAINELEGRLVTINIMKKVVDKMAGVYNEAPVRSVVDQNKTDKELLELYEDAMSVNSIQKETNRHLKMFKKALKKFYVDKYGNPKARLIPAHAYEVFNVINPDITQPDIVAEIIRHSDVKEDQEIHFYSDESFFITDGTGAVKTDKMLALEQRGKNPVKELPFTYTTTSTYSIDPIIDDDLLHISIAIPIVLTDLLFACKYQCWSLIYTIGVEGNINMNPSSVIQLNYDNTQQKPEIGTIKPQVDSDKVLSLVEGILNMFLSAKGLTVGTISTGFTSQNATSGVSKMLDSAESVEDKKDQQELFLRDESQIWSLIAKFLIPYWRRNQMLNADMNRQFSKPFKVAVVFKEPKVMLSEKDKTELSILKINNNLTTIRRELKNFNPDFTDEQIDDLMQEIFYEKAEIKELSKMSEEKEKGDDENGEIQSDVQDQSRQDIQQDV